MKRLLIFILLFGLIASSYAQSRLGVTTDASLVWQTDDIDNTTAKTVIFYDKLAVGNYTVNVTYFDDNNYEESRDSKGFTVSPVEPNLNVTSESIYK